MSRYYSADPIADFNRYDRDGSMTTREFLELTKDSYGGDIIKRTIKAYEGEK